MMVKSQSPRAARWRVPSCAPSLTAHYRQIAARRAVQSRLRRWTPRSAAVLWRSRAVAAPRSTRYHWLELGMLYGLALLALLLGALGVLGLAQ